MENQHQKINGYRELTQVEIDLMNRIKEFGPQFKELIHDIRLHIEAQYEAAVALSDVQETNAEGVAEYARLKEAEGVAEYARLEEADAHRWVDTATTGLQNGLMALTRAVAQPTIF